MIYETERLLIRQFTTNDQNNFFQLNGDEQVVRYIRPVKTFDESNQRLQEIIETYDKTPLLGGWAVELKSTDIFIGMMAVFPIEKSTNIQLGYSLIPKYWGRGYATEIANLGIKHAFNVVKLSTLFATCEVENSASLKVLQKTGFVKEKLYREDEKEVLLLKITNENFINTLA